MELQINSTIRASKIGGKRPLSAIRAIVFHYTANTGSSASALGNARYFANGSEGRAASAHYCVDEKNIVYECVPLDTVAWSVGDGRSGKYGNLVNNYNSVSIEMVSHTDASGAYYIPKATQENAARLYQMLLKKLPGVQYAVRHYDVSGKLCPLPMIAENKWKEFQKLLKEVDEVVEKSKMIIDGKEVPVERILKNGTNYIKVRDLAAALDLDVSSKGNIAVLKHKEK
jgi:N-acetylmuramoyl-L-alanine amidase CwlA